MSKRLTASALIVTILLFAVVHIGAQDDRVKKPKAVGWK